MRSSTRALVLLAAVLGLLLPAATPASATTQLHGKMLPGSGWTAATVQTDGRELTSTLTATDVSRPFQAGVRVYDSQRRVVFAGTVNELGSSEGVLVDAKVQGISLTRDTRAATGTRLGAVDVVVTLNAKDSKTLVGSYTVVVWTAAAKAGPSRWSVQAGQGVSVRGTATGPETWLHDSSNFTGALNAQVGTQGLAARAGYATQQSVRVKRTLVGSFAPVLTSVDSMSVTLPDGRTQQCVPSCDFSEVVGDGAARAGEYLFNLTGAGAGGLVQNTGDVLLGGADVLLPAV